MEISDPQGVTALLAEYGQLAHAEVQRYLAHGEPRRHLYDLANDYPNRGGRHLRASLCIAVARAYGASTCSALKTAAAIELLHNAFLVHDDIEDDSEQRRGAPTLHVLHGAALAVNVGDGLAMLALRPLIDNVELLGTRLALRILEDAQRMARESIEGQAIELGWRSENASELLPDDYLTMVLKKTCWYTTIFPCRAGALIGSRQSRDLDRFIRFGFFLGAAFQIQDDLLNLLGDPIAYGKELNGDLREGKRTLMLIHLLRRAEPREQHELIRILSLPREQRGDAQVHHLLERMRAHQSIEYARRVAHGLAGAAVHEFDLAFSGVPPSRDARFLRALPGWVLARN
jgi:geranylgeranyl diphosphate synthase, type II